MYKALREYFSPKIPVRDAIKIAKEKIIGTLSRVPFQNSQKVFPYDKRRSEEIELDWWEGHLRNNVLVDIQYRNHYDPITGKKLERKKLHSDYNVIKVSYDRQLISLYLLNKKIKEYNKRKVKGSAG